MTLSLLFLYDLAADLVVMLVRLEVWRSSTPITVLGLAVQLSSLKQLLMVVLLLAFQ